MGLGLTSFLPHCGSCLMRDQSCISREMRTVSDEWVSGAQTGERIFLDYLTSGQHFKASVANGATIGKRVDDCCKHDLHAGVG